MTNAVEMYRLAAEQTPAYRAFLEEQTGEIPKVESEEDFARLPFMDKDNYVMRYPVQDLCLNGSFDSAHIWLRSSGTSRKPFFWPRRVEDEKGMPMALKRLFHRYTDPNAQPTLIIVGFALGPWGTGMQTSFAFRKMAHEVPGLAVVTPGLQNESIVEALEQIAPMYKQTLLFSYPPFAKMALEAAAEHGLDLPSLNLNLLVGGEGITESWREMMWRMLGHTERDLHSVWSLYGSTDFANVGFENPLTIAIRRHMVQNQLWDEIFGEPSVPMLFQRVPNQTHFEEVDGELIVSRIQGIPLMRYRSGDRVKFVERADLLARLHDTGFDAERSLRDAGLQVPEYETPFVALYGRINQVIFFYGAKITIEQVKMALETPVMQPYFNGRFLVRGTESPAGDPQVEVSLEESDALRSANLDEVSEALAGELAKIQSEFREVCSLAPNKTHLRVVTAPTSAFELGWKTRHM